MLFKDELIISLQQSKVRQATGAPCCEETPSKRLQVKLLCQYCNKEPRRRVCFITSVRLARELFRRGIKPRLIVTSWSLKAV